MSNFLVGNTNYAPVWKDHGTGGGTSYTLDGSGTAVGTLVYVGGSIQEPGVDYSISGTSLSMTSSITAGIGVLTCQLYALGTVNVPVDNSVTAAKTDLTLAEGSMIYGTGADAWTLLAKGAANQQLAMNAGATAPEWVTVAGGGWTFFSEQNASTSSDIKFESLAAGYDYQFTIHNVDQSADANFECQFGTGGTPTYTAANYQDQVIRAVQTTLSGAGNDGAGQTHISLSTMYGGASAGELFHGVFTLLDPGNSSTYTTIYGTSQGDDNSGVEGAVFATGMLEVAQADTAIKFYPQSGNFATGLFRMFRRANG